MTMINATTETSDSQLFADSLPMIQDALSLKHLELRLNPEWRSGEALHRQRIREDILSHTKDTKDVLDLSRPPHIKKGAVSISHNSFHGGYVYTKDAEVSLGFDLELNHRFQSALVLRVAKEAEVQEAPSFAALWTAKEASFKAMLRTAQPKTITEITLGKWLKLADNIYSVQVLAVSNRLPFKPSIGVVVCGPSQTLSIFKC